MILGSTGMLGHMVYYYFKGLNKYRIVDVSYRNKLHDGSKLLDVTKDDLLEKYIIRETPDVVINCIGVLIKASQANPANAIRLNAYFPHRLVQILRKTGGRLIHISTDCVFSGRKGNYTEDDFRDADDIYGRSKALGEVNNDVDITIRTSTVGPELKENGQGLFQWFMKQNGKIKGFDQVFWGGVTTLELAKVIDEVINQNLVGLINVTNGQSISKYNLLVYFKEIFNKTEIIIEPVSEIKSDKSLKTTRVDFKYNVHSYVEMMIEMFDYKNRNDKMYQNLI